MPLKSVLNGANRCLSLTKRTKQPCKNPAAYGCATCRMHGARKRESIRRGMQHPNYKSGRRTKQTQLETSEKLAELRLLEDLGFAIEMMSGYKTRGRKPQA